MGRKRRVCNLLLTIVCCAIYGSCCKEEWGSVKNDEVCLSVRLTGSGLVSRTCMNDEYAMKDVNIFIFDEKGNLEAVQKESDDKDGIMLSAGHHYSILACANFSQEITAETLEAILQSRYKMTSPYDFVTGMPMSGRVTDLYLERDTIININMKRITSRISIRMDRSGLDDDIEILVNRVRIGNCPSSAYVFKENSVRDSIDCFDIGFETTEIAPLNVYGLDGLSDEISLFMLENMQGIFSEEGPSSEKDKIFKEHDVRNLLCSYIEMELEYHSDSLFCTDRPLVYRFYLGDGLNNLDVERNCHYHVIVCPDGDGISEDIWRVEKSGLHSYVQEISLAERSILLDYKGQTAKINAEILPAHAYFKDLIWTSSDSEVATIDDMGIITAVSEGKCTITCSSTDGSGTTASCLIQCEFAPPRFSSYPEDKYINGNIGDTLRLWCEVFPPNTPFDVGAEYLENDKASGIYDYIVDEDGHGVTLILKKPGSGLIYMEAGEPVNDAALYFIEVNMPDDW